MTPAGDRRRRADAAVAVMLRERDGDHDVLFIRRPHRHGDRWSGDLAFPGGLAQPGEDAVATARREAHEEVAIELGAPLTRLTDRSALPPVGGRSPGGGTAWMMRIRPVVFLAPPDATPIPDPREVAEAFWFSLTRLRLLPLGLVWRRVGPLPLSLPFPALSLDGRELWGLTLSMTLELRRRRVP